MIKAIFPGTFDPVTFGHLDIITRASKIVDKLTVLVVYNSAKRTIFTFEERVEHLRYLTESLENVSVSSWNGLTADYALKEDTIIIRGVRNGSDFDYEAQIAAVNKTQDKRVETVFLATSPELSYLSSTIAKEIFNYGGNLDRMVHGYIIEKLREKKTQ